MKYPRTYHLPQSPGCTNDDKVLKDISHFANKDIVITEKMDGSNVCLESCGVFARTHSTAPKHPSFDALKAIHAAIKYQIPKEVQIFCEWLYAKHSIEYSNLPSFLMAFGVREGNSWLGWKETEAICERLGITTVPVIKEKRFKTQSELENEVIELSKMPSCYGQTREGVVIRLSENFDDDVFYKSVAKYVRANHVQTSEHWKNMKIIKNKLKV